MDRAGRCPSETHRTIVPDLLGLGASGAEQWTSFAGVAEAVGNEVSARAPDGAHIVGLSLGGIIALLLAVLRPEVCRSVLVSGVPAERVAGALRLVNRLMASVYSTSTGARLIGRVFGMPDDESMDAFRRNGESDGSSSHQGYHHRSRLPPVPAVALDWSRSVLRRRRPQAAVSEAVRLAEAA